MAGFHWNKAISGSFTTAADWNPAAVPGSADDAIIDAIGTYTVTSSQNEIVNSVDTISGATLAIAAGKTFQATLGGVNDGKVTVANGATLAISSFDDVGTISLNGSTSATSLEFIGPVNILGGNGHVTLSNSASNQIIANGSNQVVDNLADTISGAGRIGDLADTHLTFINDYSGVMNANASHALTIHTGNVFFNNGLMETTGVGGLVLQDQIANGGTIKAAGMGAHVDLDNASISGGTLITTGGAQIKTIAGATAALTGPLTLDGKLNIVDGSNLTIASVIHDDGTIALNGNRAATHIVVSATGAFLGGQVVLTDNSNNAIVTDGNAQLFENGSIVTGAGTIGDSHMSFANLATIDATGKNQLVIAANSTVNESAMEATGSGHLTIATNVMSGPNAIIEALGTGHVTLENVLITNTNATIGALASGAHLDIGTLAAGGTAEIDNGSLINVLGAQITTIVGVNQVTPTALTIKDATVHNAGTINITDNSKIVLDGTASAEPVVNSGTIALHGVAKFTELVADGTSGVVLSGHGKITLTDNDNNFISSNGTTTVFDDVDNVISGAGTIGDAHLKLEIGTAGVINASGAKHELFISAGANITTNDGTIELTGKGGLQIDSVIDNGLTGSIFTTSASGALVIASQIDGGTIAAKVAGSVIKLDNGVIVGGAVSTAVGSTITTVAGTNGNDIGNVHNAGKITVVDNSAMNMSGTVVNTGTVNVSSTGHLTELDAGNQILSGHGHLIMSDNANNLISSGQGVTVTDSSVTVLVGGTVTAGDVLSLLITDGVSFSAKETVTVTAGMNKAQIASEFAAEINVDLTLAQHDIHALTAGSFLNISEPGDNATATAVTALVPIGAMETITGSGNLAGGMNDGFVFENANNTITGAGEIGQGNVLAFHNDADGLVNANGTHQMVIDTGSYNVINHGTMETTGAGGMRIESAVANFGHLVANNSTLEIDGSLTGFGGTQIAGAHGKLDLEALTNLQDVTFAAGTKGELELEHSEGYTGRIAGFGANTTQSIDLGDINFATATKTWTPLGSNIEGTLTVTDGTHTANLTLLGHYATANFTLHDDGTGHVLVTDPPLHGSSDLLMH